MAAAAFLGGQSRLKAAPRGPRGRIARPPIEMPRTGWRVATTEARWRASPSVKEQAKPPAPSDYLDVIGVPISVPITSPEITSSTRRFNCRPSAVSLDATG